MHVHQSHSRRECLQQTVHRNLIEISREREQTGPKNTDTQNKNAESTENPTGFQRGAFAISV